MLIDADQNGVAVLKRVVRRLASGTGAIDITAERDVVGYGAIVLLAELSETSGRVTEPNTGLLTWSGSPAYWSEVEAKIGALQNANAGHQYLEESGSVQVVISVGEYDAEWWKLHGESVT